MTRPMLFCALAPLVLLAGGVGHLLLGCVVPSGGCAYREHPEHVDEYGQPDPCCLSNVPCCANPLWGRKVMHNGLEGEDPCCLEVPCPFWDVNKGADAGTGDAAPGMEKDASTSPEMDAGADAEADGGH